MPTTVVSSDDGMELGELHDTGAGLGLAGRGAYGSLSSLEESDQARDAGVKIQPARGGKKATHVSSESKEETHQDMPLAEPEVEAVSGNDLDGQSTLESQLLPQVQAQGSIDEKKYVIEVAGQSQVFEKIERSRFQKILKATYEVFDSTAAATFLLGPVGDIYAISASCVAMPFADFALHRFADPATTHENPPSVFPSKGEIVKRLLLAGLVAGAADITEIYADPRISVCFVKPFGGYVVLNYMAHGLVTFTLVKAAEAMHDRKIFADDIKEYEQNPSKKQKFVKRALEAFRNFSQAEMLRTIASYCGSSVLSHPFATLGAELLRELVGYLTTPVQKSEVSKQAVEEESKKEFADVDRLKNLAELDQLLDAPANAATDALEKFEGDGWDDLDESAKAEEKAISSSAKVQDALQVAFEKGQKALVKAKSAGSSAAKAGMEFAKKAHGKVHLARVVTALAISSGVAVVMQNYYKKDKNSLGQSAVSDAVTLASFWFFKDCLLPAGLQCWSEWKQRKVDRENKKLRDYVGFVNTKRNVQVVQQSAEPAQQSTKKPG